MEGPSFLLDLARQYFNVVRNSLEFAINSGNKWAITGKADATEEEMHDRFRKATEWSDFSILIPLLYNFYHGIELLMKQLTHSLIIIYLRFWIKLKKVRYQVLY